MASIPPTYTVPARWQWQHGRVVRAKPDCWLVIPLVLRQCATQHLHHNDLSGTTLVSIHHRCIQATHRTDMQPSHQGHSRYNSHTILLHIALSPTIKIHQPIACNIYYIHFYKNIFILYFLNFSKHIFFTIDFKKFINSI